MTAAEIIGTLMKKQLCPWCYWAIGSRVRVHAGVTAAEIIGVSTCSQAIGSRGCRCDCG